GPVALIGSWDRLRLHQVCSNLLNNSLRYGGKTPVILSVCEGRGGAIMTVRYYGPGIAKSDKQRNFEKFMRGQTAEHTADLSLSLFISRKIVQSHQCQLSVESEPGRGAAFFVQVPLEPLSN